MIRIFYSSQDQVNAISRPRLLSPPSWTLLNIPPNSRSYPSQTLVKGALNFFNMPLLHAHHHLPIMLTSNNPLQHLPLSQNSSIVSVEDSCHFFHRMPVSLGVCEVDSYKNEYQNDDVNNIILPSNRVQRDRINKYVEEHS